MPNPTRRPLKLIRASIVAAMLALPVHAAETPADDIPVEDIRLSSFTGAFLAGRAAEASRDIEGAIHFYERAMTYAPEDQGVRQALFLSLVAAGDIEQALPLAEKLRDEPDISRLARLVLVTSAIKARQFQDARAVAELGENAEPDRQILAVLRALAEAGAGKHDDAVKLLETTDGPVWFGPFKAVFGAMIAEMGGDKADAAARYAKALSDETAMAGTPELYLRGIEAYARLLTRTGETAQAIAMLEKGRQVAPLWPLFDPLEQRIKAGEVLKPMVADAAQGASELLYTMAMAINRRGAEPFVRRFLNTALHLTPGRDLLLYELARLDEIEGLNARAVAGFRSVPADSALHRTAAMQAALNLASLDRDDEAKAELRSLIAEDPTNLRAYMTLGSILASQKDFASAATLYSDALQAIPDDRPDVWSLYYYRGIAHERLKDWEKAEPDLRKALSFRPDDPQILNYLGYTFIDRGENLDEALGMVRKAVDLAKTDGYIVDSLGWAYYRLGRYDEAVAWLECAIRLQPGDAVINDHLGDAYWQVGRLIEARFQWSHAAKGEPDLDLKPVVERKVAEGKLDTTGLPARVPPPEGPIETSCSAIDQQ